MDISLLKQILLVLAILGLIASVIWRVKGGGYDSIVAIVGSVATIISLFISKMERTANKSTGKDAIITSGDSSNLVVKARKIQGGNFANKVENNYYLHDKS